VLLKAGLVRPEHSQAMAAFGEQVADEAVGKREAG
jgi:hypothetical protein